jgi:rhamnosyltransferase
VELGPASFFSSANGAVARRAWERVPFRQVPYAEDQRLALDMLAAGFSKAYVPDAGVVHSHEYGALDQFRRTFDEFRALREVYGHREPLLPRRVRREVAADRAFAGSGVTWESLRYHSVRALGGALGSRADRLPAPVRRACSLERRATFEPSD